MPMRVETGGSGERVTLSALFLGFLKVSLCGFGGGLVWARRVVVEQKRWMDEQEFAEVLTLCQLMPGPNIVGITVCVGAKLRGAMGATIAVAGFILLPWSVGLSLGGFLLQHGTVDRDRIATAGALSKPPHGAALRRTCFRRHGVHPAAAADRAARIGARQHCRRAHRRHQSTMNGSSASLVLAAHLAVLSSLSFGGFPTVLPDVHDFAVARGWISDQEFANYFAVSQVAPGPNMILMMSFIGLKVGGIAGAAVGALATFGPPCTMYYVSYRLWDRFREMPWQRIVRRGLDPLTIGLVIAGGYVMACSAAVGWQNAAITAAAVVMMMFARRLNPLWILTAGGALGGFGFL
jgi:chromate transporter